jgi:hypothetical protein
MRLFEAAKLQLTMTNEPNVGRPWADASELGHEQAARAPMFIPIMGSPERSATRACVNQLFATGGGTGAGSRGRVAGRQGGRAAGHGAG